VYNYTTLCFWCESCCSPPPKHALACFARYSPSFRSHYDMDGFRATYGGSSALLEGRAWPPCQAFFFRRRAWCCRCRLKSPGGLRANGLFYYVVKGSGLLTRPTPASCPRLGLQAKLQKWADGSRAVYPPLLGPKWGGSADREGLSIAEATRSHTKSSPM
jgi:hypothetical protein